MSYLKWENKEIRTKDLRPQGKKDISESQTLETQLVYIQCSIWEWFILSVMPILGSSHLSAILDQWVHTYLWVQIYTINKWRKYGFQIWVSTLSTPRLNEEAEKIQKHLYRWLQDGFSLILTCITPPSHELILKWEVFSSKNNCQPGSSNFLKECDRPFDKARKQIVGLITLLIFVQNTWVQLMSSTA